MNTVLALAVGLSACTSLIVSEPILNIPYDPNQNRHLFSSIIVKDTAALPETNVTFEQDNFTTYFQVKEVVASSALMFLPSDLTADQVRGRAPWIPHQAVRIAPDDANTVLTVYFTKRVDVAVEHARATLKIEDREGNKDTRRFNFTEMNLYCPLNKERTHNVCTGSDSVHKLPSFSLPRYEDLPSWARNRGLISLTFSIEDCLHLRTCRHHEKKLMSAHLYLSTVSDDLE